MDKNFMPGVIALLLVGAVLPASAQNYGDYLSRIREAEPASNNIQRIDDLSLTHKVRLRLPQELIGDGSGNAPKLSIDLGYGRSLPSFLGSTSPRTNLPNEFLGRSGQSAIKASVSVGF